MNLFYKLFQSLSRANVKYMIAGGVAVNLYGIERATADIDLILKLDGKNLLNFAGVTKELSLKPKLPISIEDFTDPEKRKSWIRDKGMMVFSLIDLKNPFFLLDIMIDYPFDFDEVYKIRAKIKYENITIPVVPIEKLIEMKKKSNRPQDRADIHYLKKILKDLKDEK